jgi:membrane-associated phospholipid phosphatase
MIDDSWYRAVTGFAQTLPWLSSPAVAFSEYAIFLIFPAFLAMGWWSRTRGVDTAARVLWVPCAVALAYGIDWLLKLTFAERRPCRVLAGVHTLLPCDAPTDYSFPSNHTVVVAAFAAAVFLVHRRWGVYATILAVLVGFSRVYIGAHYPHDVLAGAVVGTAVALAGVPLHPYLVAFSRRAVDAFGSRVTARRATPEDPGMDMPVEETEDQRR